MKRKWTELLIPAGVTISFLLFCVLYPGYVARHQAEPESSYNSGLDTAKVEEKGKVEKAVDTEGEAVKEEEYYVATVQNGYVVILLSDGKTAYQYTSIEAVDLPEEMQEQLKNNTLIFHSQQELYGFLENYSS